MPLSPPSLPPPHIFDPWVSSSVTGFGGQSLWKLETCEVHACSCLCKSIISWHSNNYLFAKWHEITDWCSRPCHISKVDFGTKLKTRKAFLCCSNVLYRWPRVFCWVANLTSIEDFMLQSTYLTPEASKFLSYESIHFVYTKHQIPLSSNLANC